MKKLAMLTMALVMALSLAACGAPAATPEAPEAGPIKVGIINNPPSESGYREANVRDFETVFTAANGYDARTFYSITNDEQLNAARQFITDGVDVLLISAAETTGWDSVLTSAKEAGIKVFLFDRMIDVDQSLFEAAVVSDMRNQGEIAVNWLTSLNLPEYNIIHIQGAMASDAQIGRTNPLNEAVNANAHWNLVTQQTATWDEATAKQIVESVINSGDSFNIVYAENDGMAAGAVAALGEAGISHGVDKDVIIIGFDCNTWALEELLKGNWNYNVQCSPFQAGPIDNMIKNGVTQKIVISDEKGFDARTITQADIDQNGI